MLKLAPAVLPGLRGESEIAARVVGGVDDGRCAHCLRARTGWISQMRSAIASCESVDRIRSGRREDGIAALVGVKGGPCRSRNPRWGVETPVHVDGAGLILRMVEQVEEVELELHVHSLRELEVLPHGQIDVAVAGARANPSARVAKHSNLQAIHSEGVWIEPLAPVASAGPTGLPRNAH